VLDRLAFVDQFLERVNADAQVDILVCLCDSPVAGGGLDAAVYHGFVRDEEQCPGGDLVVEAGDEQGGCFHVNGHGADAAQVGLEGLVVLPDAAVGRVNGARPIVTIVVADRRRDCFLQVEGGQGRHLGRKVVAGGAFAADGRDRQDQIADLVLFLEAAAFPQKETGLWLDGAQQVHDRGGVGAAHPEVDQRDAFGSDVGHGVALAANGDVEPLRERGQVGLEVDQQNVLAEICERGIGVTRKPVGYDFFFCFHSAASSRNQIAVIARRALSPTKQSPRPPGDCFPKVAMTTESSRLR